MSAPEADPTPAPGSVPVEPQPAAGASLGPQRPPSAFVTSTLGGLVWNRKWFSQNFLSKTLQSDYFLGKKYLKEEILTFNNKYS